jgi:hypothetical protein
MINDKAVERLSNNADFAAFLEEVWALREGHVANLHDLDTARLQQISGKILAFDQVCQIGGIENVREKWRRIGG